MRIMANWLANATLGLIICLFVIPLQASIPLLEVSVVNLQVDQSSFSSKNRHIPLQLLPDPSHVSRREIREMDEDELSESPRTRLLHQQQRMRQQQEEEEEGSAAARTASEAALAEEEEQPTGDDEDDKSLDREMVTVRTLSKPGYRKRPLLDEKDDPIGPGGDDVNPVIPPDPPVDCLAGLENFSGIDQAAPSVKKFACMVDKTLKPWMGIPGATKGMGRKGMIHPGTFQILSRQAQIMSCCGHIKIVDGLVYFRYGGFFGHWYRLLRFVQSVKAIRLAIRRYKLFNLRAEFFLNTCDVPSAYDSSIGPGDKAGLPIFSTEHVAGSIDILYPDPLDLTGGYITPGKRSVPWSEKVPKAVFRGGATNFRLAGDYRWRGSPRFRLHQMTDVRPDLLDARIMRLLAKQDILDRVERDGVVKGGRMPKEKMATFKYEVVVDGGSGTCRTCGVLASDMLMIRQESPFSEFFQPMLRPWVHFIPTGHNFEDLFARVEWARENDKEVQKMVSAAHKVARWACSWDGRMLYWAVLLAKYSTQAMQDASAVRSPKVIHNCSVVPEPRWMLRAPDDPKDRPPMPPNYPPLCPDEDVMERQVPCSYFCINGRILHDRHVWVKANLFDTVDPVGPRLSQMPVD